MSTLADIRTKVIGITRDDSGKIVNPTDYDRIINAAVNYFSRHRPDYKVVDVVGAGVSDYALPTGWVDGFSSIEDIEYPLNDVPATLIDKDSYEVYQTPAAKKLRLKYAKPTGAESFRIAFTILRTATTIPDGDVDALCNLASAFCLEELANMFAQTSDATLSADSVNYKSKSSEFSQRAKRLLQLYKEHIGIKEDDSTSAASAVVDLDVGYPGGRERLTHPRWARERR